MAGSSAFWSGWSKQDVRHYLHARIGRSVAVQQLSHRGFTYREGHLICEKAHRSRKMVGREIVEVNPVLDQGNRTAQMAVGLVASAMGKTIL